MDAPRPRCSRERDAAPLASVTAPLAAVDPIALFAAAVEADLEAALWLRPADGTALVGIGRAWATASRVPIGSPMPSEPGASCCAAARVADASPVLCGGLGFTGRRPDATEVWSAFGPASLVLPELLAASTPTGATLTASAVTATSGVDRRWAALDRRARELEPSPNGMVARPVVAPLAVVGEHPDREAWDRLVGQFAGAVGRGRIDKVVLARRVDLRSPIELDVPNALRRLAASAPESTIYAFRRDGRTFLGATPERLARTEGRSFRTMAVAGSIRRGADAAEDEALATELLASEKDREEQAIVVDAIREQLAPIAETLMVAPEPSVMRLRFVQHLATEITGTAARGARPPVARRSPAPDPGRWRAAARRGAGDGRGARGLRSGLVCGPDRLARRGRRRRAVRRPALRHRRPHAGHAVRRLRDRRRLGPGRRVGGVADEAPGRDLGARDPGGRGVSRR